MTLVKRNSAYWYIQFQMDGKTYIRSSRTTNKKAAGQMETEWKAKLHAQRFLGHRERMTIHDAIVQVCASRKGTPSHSGLAVSRRALARLMPMYKSVDEITSQDLERFKRDRLVEGVGLQTIKHNLGLVRAAWSYAKRLGYHVGELDFPKIRPPKRPLRYLSMDEEQRLLEHLDPLREGRGLRVYDQRDDEMKRNMQDAYDLVVLLLDTGARYGEIANIEWSRIGLTDRTINLWRPKVQNETILFMTDRVFDVLSRRAANCATEFVFSNRSGGPRGYASQAIRKAIRGAGLKNCRIHTFRHTHASRLVQNGVSIHEVREVLGHTDIGTTMLYAHLEARQATAKARDVINKINADHLATS